MIISRFRKRALGALGAVALGVGLMLGGGVPAVADEHMIAKDPDNAIKYRQAVMEIVGASASSMAAIAKGDLDHNKAFADLADMLAMAGELTYDAFKQNTHGKGKEKTTAKEDVWTDWEKFREGLDDMNEQAIKIAEFAAAGNLGAAKGSLEDLFKTCKTCHDDFREK